MVPGIDHRRHEVAADEAGGAGDEDGRHEVGAPVWLC
jgi:hypothetical protein